MRLHTLLAAGLVSLVLTLSASADFVELTVVQVSEKLIQVYADFDDPNDSVLNVFNRNLTNPAGWFHDDLETFLDNDGNWRPDSLSTAEDSFITIGVLPGDPDAAAISVDPNFANGGLAFPGQTDLGTDAGWLNTNPSNNAGNAGLEMRVLIAQFSHVHSRSS